MEQETEDHDEADEVVIGSQVPEADRCGRELLRVVTDDEHDPVFIRSVVENATVWERGFVWAGLVAVVDARKLRAERALARRSGPVPAGCYIDRNGRVARFTRAGAR